VGSRFVVDVATIFGEVGRLLPLANIPFSLHLRRNPGWLVYAADRRSLYIILTPCWYYFWVGVFIGSRDRLDEPRREASRSIPRSGTTWMIGVCLLKPDGPNMSASEKMKGS